MRTIAAHLLKGKMHLLNSLLEAFNSKKQTDLDQSGNEQTLSNHRWCVSLVFINLLPSASGLDAIIKLNHFLKELSHSNRPFARSGHMLQNHTCWWASCAVGLPKQRQVQVDWYELHCFVSPTVQLAHQHVWFFTMWPDRAKGLFGHACAKLPLNRRKTFWKKPNKPELFENDDVTIITWFSRPSFSQTQIQNGRWQSTVRKKDGGCTFYHNTLRTKLSPLGIWKDIV